VAWPDDIYAPDAAPPPDPFGPPAPLDIHPAWLDLVASSPTEPPRPDPLGLPPSAMAGVDAALAPPPSVTPTVAAPPEAPPQDQLAAFGTAPEPTPASNTLPPPFVLPEMFGGPPPEMQPPPALAHEAPAGTGPSLWQEDQHAAYPADYTPTTDPNAPEYDPMSDPRLSVEDQARGLARLGQQDPAQYAELKAKRQRAEELEFATRLEEEKTKSLERAEENTRIYAQAAETAQRETADLQREAKALAGQKVDSEGWYKSRSVPQKIAAFLAAIVGGLVQGRTGGRNSGLDAIMQASNEWVETQKFNLQQQKADLQRRQGLAGEQLTRAADVYRTGEVYRIASLQRIADQIATERGQYDPKGRAAFELAEVEMGIRSAQKKAEQDFRDKQLKQGIEVGRYNLDVAKQAEEERKNRQAAIDAKASQALGRSRLAFDKDKQQQDIALRAADLQDKRDERAQTKADKAAETKAKQDLELGVGGAMQTKKVMREVPDPVTGKPVMREVTEYTPGALRDKNGEIWHAPDAVTAQKLRAQGAGAQGLIDAFDDVKQLRASAGGANKFTSPGDTAAYKSAINKAVIAYGKANELSLSDEQSVNLVRDRLFGGDPSGYRVGDVESRIEKAIGDVKRGYYTTLKGTNFDGELPQFERAPGESQLTEAKKLTKVVEQGKTPLELAEGAPGAVVRGAQRVLYPFSEPDSAEKFESWGDATIPGLDLKEAKAVKALVSTATGKAATVEAKDDARQQLVNLATSDRPSVRSAVLKVLEERSPDLFEAAVPRLPEEERDTWINYAVMRAKARADFNPRSE
jgi:hypothetical protein